MIGRHRTRALRRTTGLALVVAATWAPLPPASADHNAFEQVSIGAIGGDGPLPSQLVGTSADGTRVFLRTEEQLAASDTDAVYDVYERAGSVTTHLSIGPSGGNTPGLPARFRGASVDGSRVFFQTAERLVASDTDDCEPADPEPNGCNDVYERSGGVTTLVSTAPGGNGAYPSSFAGASEAGTRVFFTTEEPLVSGDADTSTDVYERVNGTTTLVSAGGNAPYDAYFRGASADGTRAFISTTESLTAADTDSASDVYERSGGTTTLLSTGPGGGNGAADASFEGASRDGTCVFFSTAESLTSSDTDASSDVYESSSGTTTLLSGGSSGGNGAFAVTFKSASEGGTRVFFETAEPLVSADSDSSVDVYERSGGTTILVSAGGNGPADALFQGASDDGAQVVFATSEAMLGTDTDGRIDLYRRSAGTTTLASTGPPPGNGAFDAFFSGMSGDGMRIFFETAEQLTSDADGLPDVYERSGGTTTRISTGPNGGNGADLAVFLGASEDGSRVFFTSSEALAGSDGDAAFDIYLARTAVAYARPLAASPMKAALVLAYRQCTSPNRVHGPPALGGGAFDPSCSPPTQESGHLTVGTFDANQQNVQFVGSVRLGARVGDPSTPADESDVNLRFRATDVRNQGGLSDYTGEVTISVPTRITDKYNGSVPADPATVVDMPFRFVAPCSETADTAVGATCALDTTADVIVPGAVREGKRAMWQLGRVEVYDGGSDGVAGTPGDTLFAVQGIFVP